MAPNPILRLATIGKHAGQPLVELKKRIVLYLEQPPGPLTAADLYGAYMHHFGDSVRAYRSTIPGDIPLAWTAEARAFFESELLPTVGSKLAWGYSFHQGTPTDERRFMFHGFRPVAEPDLASFVTADFEWDADPEIVVRFMAELVGLVPCVSGVAGWVLEPNAELGDEAREHMLGLALRYWGAQAQCLEADVVGAGSALRSIGWVTYVGARLVERAPHAVEAGRLAAAAATSIGHGWLLRAEDLPRLLDRNRREPLGRYVALARALAPLLAQQCEAYDDQRWDELRVLRYQHRFLHPDRIV